MCFLFYRFRAGIVIFNYRDRYNMLQKTEGTTYYTTQGFPISIISGKYQRISEIENEKW